jgi:type IV secretory pathway VirB3-like protein
MSDLHSVMLKRVGSLAAVVGIAMIAIMSVAFFVLQGLATIWGYFITVGVWFIVIGFALWLGGAAMEYREQNHAEITTEQAKTGLDE